MEPGPLREAVGDAPPPEGRSRAHGEHERAEVAVGDDAGQYPIEVMFVLDPAPPGVAALAPERRGEEEHERAGVGEAA